MDASSFKSLFFLKKRKKVKKINYQHILCAETEAYSIPPLHSRTAVNPQGCRTMTNDHIHSVPIIKQILQSWGLRGGIHQLLCLFCHDVTLPVINFAWETWLLFDLFNHLLCSDIKRKSLLCFLIPPPPPLPPLPCMTSHTEIISVCDVTRLSFGT